MKAIDIDLYARFSDHPTHIVRNPNRKKGDKEEYYGEKLGLEHLYTWYRELQDADDGSFLFYYNDFPRDQQIIKFEEELYAEARTLYHFLQSEHSKDVRRTL